VSCTNLPGLPSLRSDATTRETWCRAPSHKPQATSSKQQATSFKLRRFVIYASKMGMIIWSRAARELVSTIRSKPCEACIRGEAGGSSQTKGERHESYNKSRMEMAGRTGPSFRGSYYPSSEGSRIRSRKRFHPGTSLGGQTKSQIQRRGAAATRRCSVSRFPPFRKNLIIPRAPAASWGIPSSSPARLKPQATSNKLFKAQAPSCSRCKRQASSPKQQASSFKPQAASSRT
jgi:hypothetical protein